MIDNKGLATIYGKMVILYKVTSYEIQGQRQHTLYDINFTSASAESLPCSVLIDELGDCEYIDQSSNRPFVVIVFWGIINRQNWIDKSGVRNTHVEIHQSQAGEAVRIRVICHSNQILVGKEIAMEETNIVPSTIADGEVIEHEVTEEMVGTNGMILVTKLYKESGIVSNEENSEELVEVPAVHPGALLGEVSYHGRMTVNTGDYESVQVGVSVTLPAYVSKEQLEEAYLAAKSFVEERLNTQVQELRDYLKSKA